MNFRIGLDGDAVLHVTAEQVSPVPAPLEPWVEEDAVGEGGRLLE